MAVEKTYAMIKPGALKAGHDKAIIDRIKQEGFSIVAMKKLQMTKDLAEQFYAVHKEKPFFSELVDSIISGPVIAMVLEKEDAITAWRDLMGVTDPAKAADGTIRKLYGVSIGENATHGSDAPETAATEISLIFSELV
jgi:nucleoside-diphosphate kinase